MCIYEIELNTVVCMHVWVGLKYGVQIVHGVCAFMRVCLCLCVCVCVCVFTCVFVSLLFHV